MLESRDPRLMLALKACDVEQMALLGYETDPQWQRGLWANLGEREEAVAAAFAALQHDKSHVKSLRLKARSLQRFLERQVLIAEVLCSC